MVKKPSQNKVLQSPGNSGKAIGTLLIAFYLLAIITANLSITHFGPQAAIYNAFFLIAFDLTVRDNLHEQWRGKNLWPKMMILIATGSILSWFLNRQAGPVALASFVAFAGAGLADTIIYWLLGKKSRLFKMNGSNIVSSFADSLIFGLWLAFPWWIIAGQIIAKVLGGGLWSVVLTRIPALKPKPPSPAIAG